MLIQPIPVLKDNYIWLLISDETKQVIIIDPGSAEEILEFLRTSQLTPIAILITHHHWDHTNGIVAIKNNFPNIDVYGPRQQHIEGVNKLVDGGDSINFTSFNLILDVLAIPGHTLSHIAYTNKQILFCGDTLFSAGCGRLFEGTPAQMLSSLKQLLALPDTTAVYPAHEYTRNNLRFAALIEPQNTAIQQHAIAVNELAGKGLPTLPSSIALEKAINPFLRTHEPDVVNSASRFAGSKLKDEVDVFTALRHWKDQF